MSDPFTKYVLELFMQLTKKKTSKKALMVNISSKFLIIKFDFMQSPIFTVKTK